MAPARKKEPDESDDPAWDCQECPYRHHPLAVCPRPAIWLVLSMCKDCTYVNGRYCRRHARPGWR